MATAAARVTQEVVAESVGVTLTRAPTDGQPTPPLARAGEPFRHTLPAPAGLTSRVLRTRHQETLTEAAALADEGIVPDFGWLLCTPVGFGQDVYGYMGGRRTSTRGARQRRAGPDDHRRSAGSLPSSDRHPPGAAPHSRGVGAHGRRHGTRDGGHQAPAGHSAVGRRAAHRSAAAARSAGHADGALLKAIRGLCRKAARVATSAGVFASPSRRAAATAIRRLSCDELLGIPHLVGGGRPAAVRCQSEHEVRRRIGIDQNGVRAPTRRDRPVVPATVRGEPSRQRHQVRLRQHPGRDHRRGQLVPSRQTGSLSEASAIR